MAGEHVDAHVHRHALGDGAQVVIVEQGESGHIDRALARPASPGRRLVAAPRRQGQHARQRGRSAISLPSRFSSRRGRGPGYGGCGEDGLAQLVARLLRVSGVSQMVREVEGRHDELVLEHGHGHHVPRAQRSERARRVGRVHKHLAGKRGGALQLLGEGGSLPEARVSHHVVVHDQLQPRRGERRVGAGTWPLAPGAARESAPHGQVRLRVVRLPLRVRAAVLEQRQGALLGAVRGGAAAPARCAIGLCLERAQGPPRVFARALGATLAPGLIRADAARRALDLLPRRGASVAAPRTRALGLASGRGPLVPVDPRVRETLLPHARAPSRGRHRPPSGG
mmetsp:Transcript_6672/g.19531  ORF Transcript_6672/g.19531 Transcript_6672/m.19531 type:complete len:339 (+) Transcript_6672:1429-2445(+)